MWTRLGDAAGAGAVVASSGLGDVPAAEGMYVVITIGGILWVANQAKQIWGKKQEVPQPLEARLLQDVASRDEMDMKVREVWGQIEKERNLARESLGKTHRRIDLVVHETAEIKGRLEKVDANVERLLDLELKKGSS